MCHSLAAVPNKSSVVTVATPDAEKPLPEDEEKLMRSVDDSEA